MRPVNLFIIGLTMWVFHRFLAQYAIAYDVPIKGLTVGLIVLVLSTMVIAGAGNMINDYFDIRIDRVNKPDHIIIGKYVKRREAMLLHIVLNTLAVGAGILLWIKYGTWIPAAIHVFTTTTLWLYSVVLKRKLLIGNISIAILTSLVPLIVLWFELPLLHQYVGGILPVVKKVIYVYAGFAFLTTLIREIQKDFADEEGDKMYGCKTVPVVLGVQSGKIIISSLLVVVICLISSLLYLKPFILNHPSAWMLLTVFLPLFFSLYITLMANNRKAWLLASNMMKLTMLGGILYLAVFIYVS